MVSWSGMSLKSSSIHCPYLQHLTHLLCAQGRDGANDLQWYRYSTVNPDTGLHPRPSDPDHLSSLFPPHSIDVAYTSTLFPSRRGESIRELQGRADTFVEAWTGRVEELGVKCVVVFAHAASVIALGRAVSLSLMVIVVGSPFRKKGRRELLMTSS